MNNSIRMLVPCVLMLGFAAGAAQAQNFGPADQRESWMENSRSQVWKNGFGECWHSQFGPPPPASQCGTPVAAYTPPPAPVVVTAPPAQVAPRAVVAAAPAPVPAPYVAPVLAPKKDRN